MKNKDTVVCVSGGTESTAALLYAVNKGMKVVGLHLADKSDPKKIFEASKQAAEKQCELLGVPLVTTVCDIPKDTPGLFAVYQYQSAILQLIKGNKMRVKNIVWGSSAEDSFRQRVQLRYPNRILAVDAEDVLEVTQVSLNSVMNLPVNIFPFEWMTKAEIISLLVRSNKELYDLIFTCNNPTDDLKTCGRCKKCAERWFSEKTAKQAKLRIQESVNYVNSYDS